MSLKTAEFARTHKILFILMFLALGSVYLSIQQGISYFQTVRAQRKLVEDVSWAHIHNILSATSRFFANGSTAITIVGSTKAMHDAACGDYESLCHLEEVFQETLENIPEVYQFRYIDALGLERLRIDEWMMISDSQLMKVFRTKAPVDILSRPCPTVRMRSTSRKST